MKPTILCGLIAGTVFVAALANAPAFGAAGDLDATFGDGGVLELPLNEYSIADAVAQLPSGQILLGGTVGLTGAGGVRDFLLGHISTDGVPEPAFGADGFAIDSLVDGGPEEITRLLVQPDGKILVVGYGMSGMTFENIVARYNADGTRDSDFGTDGAIIPSPGFAIAEDLDGNVLVGGPASANQFAVTRYTNQGDLDTGFGSGGTLTGTIAPAITVDLHNLAVDAEGRIVLSAKADDVDAVARYLSDGTPDTDFGTGGFIYNFCGDGDSIADLGFQSDGSIVLAVATHVGGNDRLCLLRFTDAGEIDNGFDADGKIISDIPGVTKETPTALDVMKDDRIVVGGEIDAGPADSGFFAARYLKDGAPDTSFSDDGFAAFNLFPGGTDFGVDVLTLNDGRVVVSGSKTRASNISDFDATLIALQGDVTDLAITQTADSTSGILGSGVPVVFTIHAANKGPLAAFGVTVTDDVPSALSVSSATTSIGSCAGAPKVVCDLGVLNPGDEAIVTVTAMPASIGEATNTVVVAGQIGDSNPSDNAASVDLTVANSGGNTAGGGSGGGCSLVR